MPRALTARILIVATVVLLAAPIPPARVTAQQAAYALPEAVTIGLARNPQILAAAAAVKAAEAQVAVVRAGQSPTAGLGVSGSTAGTSGSTSTSASVSLNVSYLVYDGGLRQAQIRQAEAQAESARQTLAVTQADVAFQIVQAFMALVSAEQVIALREQVVAQTRTQLQAAQANFQAGRVARADVLRAESTLASAEVDLVDARGQIESRRATLRATMGLDAAAPARVTPPGPPPAAQAAEAEALERAALRPEVRRSEADVRAGEAALAAAMIQGGITATLDGRYVLVTTAGTGAGNWSVGTTISIPLFDGGKRVAQVEQARANLDAAKARLEVTRQTVRQEAVQAVTQVVALQAKADASQRAVAAAREAFNVAEGRYAAGIGTIVEVTTARTELTASEVALLQTTADRWTAAARLRRAMAQPVLP